MTARSLSVGLRNLAARVRGRAADPGSCWKGVNEKKKFVRFVCLMALSLQCKICACVRCVSNFRCSCHPDCSKIRRVEAFWWLQNSKIVALTMKRDEIGKDLLQNQHPKWRVRERGKREKRQKTLRTTPALCARRRRRCVSEIFTTDNKTSSSMLFLLLAQIYGAFSKGKEWNRAGFDENGIKLKFSVQKWKRSTEWLRVLKTVLVEFTKEAL